MLSVHIFGVLLLVGIKDVIYSSPYLIQGNRNLSLTESRRKVGSVIGRNHEGAAEGSQSTNNLKSVGLVYGNKIELCRNGGTLVKIRKTYKCICPKRFLGKYCENRDDVCGRLPCAAEAKTYEVLIGGGFACRSAQRLRHDVISGCVDPSRCPSHWRCVSLGGDDFRCEPPATKRIPRSPETCANLCENGARCMGGRCDCLKHFGGKYCEEQVDYCLSSPCPLGVHCEPTLGGFACDCTAQRRGPTCNIKKKESEKSVKSITFLYTPQQNSGRKFSYCLYATSIRPDIVVHINFGDGQVVTDNASTFQHLDNLRVHLLKTFFPPLLTLHSDVYAYTINHTYVKTGYYNLLVDVTGDNRVLHSTYTVNVEPPNVCSLSLKLQNCAQTKTDAFVLQPKDAIDIRSDIHINCTDAKFTFKWSLHSPSKNDTINESNRVQLSDDIETTGHNLFIPKYTLKRGKKYTAHLKLNMTGQHSHNTTVDTWFFVYETGAPRLKIEGNSIMSYNSNSTIVLNASTSRDIRYETEREILKSYNFTWSCDSQTSNASTIKGYCAQNPLNETGPILTIPPNTLLPRRQYDFNLSLLEEPDNVVSVSVFVAPPELEVFRMECVENCGDAIDPAEMIAFRAKCYGAKCEAHKDVHLIEWSVRTENESFSTWSLDEHDTESGLKYEMLIIHSHVLKHSTKYKIILTAYFSDYTGGKKDPIGVARLYKSTLGLKSYLESNCSIFPLIGYSVFTTFTINCTVKQENALITYEVAQMQSIANVTLGQLWVSYGTESKMTNIRLSSGSADLGHLTTVTVTMRNAVGEAFHGLNVTVYPLTFHTQVPQRLFQEMYHQLFGSESDLAILHTARNCYRLVQVIRCAAAELHALINVEYPRYLGNNLHFFRDVFVMRESMLEYLSQQNVYSLVELKHYAITTSMVLDLPLTRILPSTVQVVNAIYYNILESVEKFIKRDIDITKTDYEEIGECLVSIGSKIMKRAILLTSDNSSEANYDEYDKEHNIWAVKKLIGAEMHNTPLKKLTRGIIHSILAYYKMNLKYLSLNGPVVAVQKGEFSMMVWKASYIRVDNSSFELLHGTVTPYLNENLSGKTLIVNILELNYNPYWWHYRLKHSIFPYISLHVLIDNPKQTSVVVNARIDINALENAPVPKTIRVELKVVPFWKFTEIHITVFRLKLPEGGKLALHFVPNKEKVQFVVKKDVRPDLNDFWDNGIILPEVDKLKDRKHKLLVVENMTIDKDEPVYLGIMPHIDTLRKIFEPGSSVHHYMVSDEGNLSNDDEFANVAHLKAKFNGSEPQNISLPFEFAMLVAQCYNFNQSTLKISSTCFVNDSKLYTIACTCKEMSHPMIEIKNTLVERSIFTDTPFSIVSQENPVVLIVMLYIISIFTVMFIWAWFADREDRNKRDVIFLRDNHPMHGYTYVLIVYTGRRPGSGTTSNVAIQLIGKEASSSVHILADRRRRLLTRGSQEWFVLKTEQYLGDVSWINLWHDHTGASPSWFCDKVIVHDIQTHEVWLFVTSQWLAPLHGDGSLSCSVDQTLDMDLFEHRFRFPQYFMDACDLGHHGWFSPLHAQTGDTFTRCQRVGVSLTYASVITAIVAHMYGGLTTRNGSASHVWSLDDITTGLYAALLAWPVYIGLYWLFRCIEPMSLYGDSQLSSTRSLTWNPSSASNRLVIDDAVIDNDDEGNRKKLPYTIKNEGKATNAPASRPMQGKRVVDEVFCFPSGTIYFAWLLLLIIISVCAYLSTFHGITHSNALSICFLISFTTAIVSSMLLETVKVALIAIFYTLFAKTKLMAIEDRSDLVRNLDKVYTEMNGRYVSQKLEEVSTLRKKAMYTPISYKRVLLLRKNAISDATARHIVRDICIFLMTSIILACICRSVRDSKQYYHVCNIKSLVGHDLSQGEPIMHKIKTQREYLTFINETIIPNIHKEFDYNLKPLEKGQISDWTNYLIGVPRLRQLRLSKESCADVFTSRLNWSSHCTESHTWVEGDTNDYGTYWKTPRGNDDDTIWVHNNDVDLETGATIGKVSTYPGSGYVALLERTRAGSHSTLTHLYDIKWLDHLTVALFVEFALFNANLKMVTTVSILGERSITGGYHVTNTVQAIKVDTTGTSSKTFTIAVFVTLLIVMIVRVRGESNRIARLSETRYIGNRWYALRIAVILLGAFAMSLFVVCQVMTVSSMRKLLDGDSRQFVNFYGIVYWIEVLTVVIAIMFFLIILELWHIISFYFEFQIMLTTLYVASYNLFFYFIMFIIFLLAFVWTGHLLYVSSSFKFRTIWSTFIALCGFSQQSIFDADDVYFFENTIWFPRGSFYFMFFVTYMFIFKWGFAMILINKYKRVMTYAQNAWINPILNRHVRAKCASRPLRRMQKMTRDYIQAIGILLKETSRSLSDARFRAMIQIVSQFKAQQSHDTIDPEFLTHAKNLAMASLVVDEVEERRNNDRTASISRANTLVRTSLRMAALQNKMHKLNEVVTNLIDTNEI